MQHNDVMAYIPNKVIKFPEIRYLTPVPNSRNISKIMILISLISFMVTINLPGEHKARRLGPKLVARIFTFIH